MAKVLDKTTSTRKERVTQPWASVLPRDSSSSPKTAQGSERWLLLGRLLVGLIIIAYVLSKQNFSQSWTRTDITVYSLVTSLIALNIFYLVWLYRIKSVNVFLRVQIALDISIESVLVFLTGGASSQMVVLFMLSIMSAALLLSRKDAFWFATQAIALHIISSILRNMVFQDSTDFHVLSQPEMLSTLTLHSLAFAIVAFLSGLLAYRLVVARLLSRDIFDAIGQGLLVTSNDLQIHFANDEATRLLGKSPQGGQKLDEYLPPDIVTPLGGAEIGLVPAIHETELPFKKDAKIPVRFSIRPINDEQDKLIGALVVMTDRTLECQVEDAVRHAERSAAMSEMSAAIAHEIRNPLAAMRASAQEVGRLVTEQLGDRCASTDKLLGILLTESDRLNGIITEFLSFARMKPPKRRRTNLKSIMQEAFDILQQGLDTNSDIELILDFAYCDDETQDAQEPIATVDFGNIKQAILNIGLNAIHALTESSSSKGNPEEYNTANKPRITFSLSPATLSSFPAHQNREERVPLLGERFGYKIDISDNGPGMDDEIRRKACDPFFTNRPEGTGLGLSVVDRIVKAHDGRFHIKSKPNEGTTISIWLGKEE